MNRLGVRLTVGKKLALSFSILFILLAVLGTNSLYRAHTMQTKTEEITTNWLEGVAIANNLNYLTEHILGLQLKVMTHPDANKKAGYEQEAINTFQKIDHQLEAYAATYANHEDQLNAEKLKAKWDNFSETYKKVDQLGKQINLVTGAGFKEKELLSLMDESERSFNEMQINLDEMVKINELGAKQATQESKDIYNTSVVAAIVIIVISILAVIVLLIVINQIISKPVKRVSHLLEQVAKGDLTVERMELKQQDEIGSLVQSLNDMVANLKSTMFKIQDASTIVAASSQELLASSEENTEATKHVSASIQEIAAGSETQLQSATETSRAMEEMTIGIQRIAETTSEVSELSMNASEQANLGNQSIQLLVQKMNTISDSVDESGQEIKMLEKHSENIGEVVHIIGEIAGQTSLLALNASIESARAGEHGRGFAVVANEVKKLAEQSASSVQTIKDFISQIQRDTVKSVQTMNRSMQEVKQGMAAVTEAEHAFQGIVQTSQLLSGKIQEVAASAQEMAAGSEEVSASVNEMSNVAQNAAGAAQTVAASTEEQLASVEEITSAALSLSEVAQELNELVGSFKV
ncbi:putative sensory transducer protein YvaQ [Paenibacillus baekrokdamisoli]|uniref:Putative sensory transducer protein YvaQ n=1 Tax=Paenibacillus baekrokdamisoli TaxID=1712516 RepID=A0A3G9IV28_9BACL|nr:methyl-accepting chemotaxis protein [Paenibacillus baekrokdamisoli]MBB3073357.1 methyl-accepting chemotaxis protein [Paenibacillus baekrokdamisoli]BBH22296.1 putative sensory transducer protein YvaQ [Paenibacillus baekrokdamisoli]